MTLEKQIEILKEWHEHAKMSLPIMSSEDIERFLRWLEDYKQLKEDYTDLDNRLRTANTENDRLRSASSWIPCSERLPEHDYIVLVWNKLNNTCYTAVLDHDGYYSKATGWEVDDNTGEYKYLSFEAAPYWMPLPEPPKEDNNGKT